METKSALWTEIKAVLLGESSPSKSFFFENMTPDWLLLSLRAGYTVKSFNIEDQLVDLHLWNTNSLQSNRSPYWSNNSEIDAIILFYHVNKRSTFESLAKRAEEIAIKIQKNRFWIVIGAKHAFDYDRQVSTEEGIKFAEQLNVGFFEISMDDVNVENAYDFIIKNALECKVS